MDVRRIELRYDEQQGSITIVDAAGERTVPLAGELFARLALTAAPLVRAAMGEVRGPRVDPAHGPGEAAFWQTLFERGGDGWELMRPAPPLQHWFDQFSPAGKRALVVGCGRGHEARMLAERGASVVAVDFAPAAIAEARRLTAPERQRAEGAPARDGTIDFRLRDLFALPDAEERFDLIVEHCCFCTLEPARRAAYVDAVTQLLVPGGELVGLFYAHGRTGGPPFTVSAAELEALFGAKLTQVHVAVPMNSVAHRVGEELLAVFRR